ncbi:hypothetical protein BDV39DRAFT_184348 [Aspergillus sergii]|uniref:Uncharacterized protein n=1 Tax=Aspergillus sergii TaxID=1034303 RepID=A0A5N6WML6_9EURO|nr:hypothetical protein BDV39DRAFT_184348 [Aspergillus sergii]
MFQSPCPSFRILSALTFFSILPLRFQKRGSLLWYSKERDHNGCGHLPFLSFPRHRSILRPCRALIPPSFILRYSITLLVPNQPLQ